MVIPAYERPDDLRKCLDSLGHAKQGNEVRYEILVTDDSKSARCRKLVEEEFFDVSWGKGKKIGPAGNRNAGAQRARGEWIVFLDDDCIAQEEYLMQYMNAIKSNPKVVVFEGRIFTDRPQKTWAEGSPENETGGMLWTSNLCVKKTAFKLMNGFDEQFKVAFEDVDFAYRIRCVFKNSVFVRCAAVCHPWRSLRSGGKNWKRKGYELESLKLFIAKHGTNEIANSKLYIRNMIRMLTTDQIKCIVEFRGRGYVILMINIYITLKSIWFLLEFELRKKLRRK